MIMKKKTNIPMARDVASRAQSSSWLPRGAMTVVVAVQ
jgi:hypothetical protein